MEDFKATLDRAEMTMDDLVYVTIYCPDLDLYEDFNSVYRKYFKDTFPPRAFVGSGPLLFGLRFEMQGIAVKTDWAGRKTDSARQVWYLWESNQSQDFIDWFEEDIYGEEGHQSDDASNLSQKEIVSRLSELNTRR